MLRMIIIWLIALPVAHWLLATYSRSVRREALENEFDAGGIAGLREDFIAAGMAAFEHSLRIRLIALVYVLPAVLVAVIAWFVNHN